MRRRHISVLAPISALVAVSMGLSACGGGSNEATPSPSLSAVTTARPSPTGPAATASPAAGSTTGSFTVQASNNATLGKTILVDAQGITLYRYDKDSAGTSNCTGSCATVWPPLAAAGGTLTGGSGVTGTLATISRADGSKQVTYNGMPLYTFQQDAKPGDATGDGVNSFHVVTP
jgi:predicted lipoprotein with Yx(FWY)xxD motif